LSHGEETSHNVQEYHRRVGCVRIGYFGHAQRPGGQVPKGEHRVILKVLNPTGTANLILEYAIIYSDKLANQAD